MDLAFSDEQRAFADTLDRFLKKNYGYDHRRALVAAQAWGEATMWSQLADIGCFGVALSEESGGFGGGMADLGLIARALGRHLVIEPVIPAMVAGVLLGGASDADAHAEALVMGAARYATVFGLQSEGATVSGSARGVAGVVGADLILAATDDGLLIVDSDALACTTVRCLDDTVAGDLVADAAPATRLRVGNDWAATLARARAVGQVARCWQALGTMEGALAATSAYVRERRQFGRPIAEFQVVQHRIAEMVVAAKEAEMGALLAALTMDSVPGEVPFRAVAAALSRVAAAADVIAKGAVQLHGAMGVSDELDIAARFRQLQAFRVMARSVDRPADIYVDAVLARGEHHRSAVLVEADA